MPIKISKYKKKSAHEAVILYICCATVCGVAAPFTTSHTCSINNELFFLAEVPALYSSEFIFLSTSEKEQRSTLIKCNHIS